MIRITRRCAIVPGRIELDGKTVLAGAADQSLLRQAYTALSLEYPKFFKMDDSCRLGFIAAEYLLGGTALMERHDAGSTGVILAGASGCATTDEAFYRSYADQANRFPSPALFAYTLPNIVSAEICIRHRIKGENAFFVTRGPELGFLCWYVEELFASGRVSACIMGWNDFGATAGGGDMRSLLLLLEESGGGAAGREFTQDNVLELARSGGLHG